MAAFFGCTGLTVPTVISGDDIEIEPYAFYGCTSLVRGNDVANSMKPIYKVGQSAFENCTSLKLISNHAQYIENNAYKNSGIEFANLDSIKSMGTDVFKDCTSLTRLEITGGTISSIPNIASGCVNLQRVVFGPSVTSISSFAAGTPFPAKPAGGYTSVTGEWDSYHGAYMAVLVLNSTSKVYCPWSSLPSGAVLLLRVPSEIREAYRSDSRWRAICPRISTAGTVYDYIS